MKSSMKSINNNIMILDFTFLLLGLYVDIQLSILDKGRNGG